MSLFPANRRSLCRSTEVIRGIGIHSGQKASVQVHPAEIGSGIRFQDRLTGGQIVAGSAVVSDTSRCTQLESHGVTISTVEHILSALSGLGIDDSVIEFEGRELPAMDGSAAPFVDALLSAGVEPVNHPANDEPRALARPVLVCGEGGASILAVPCDRFRATVVIDYPNHPFIGTQAVTFDSATDSYETQIAPARTFGFISELEWLRSRGLGLGASYENAVVLRDDGYDTPLRFNDELVRHKLLDLVGDLALIGGSLAAEIFAVKPSHGLNTQMAARLSAV